MSQIDYSQKWEKKQQKNKTKSKNLYQANKEQLQERL